MSRWKHDLLAPAVSQVVGDALRSPAYNLSPRASRTQETGTADPQRLSMTSRGDEFERDARQAESRPPARFDFTGVQVHTDAKAARAADALDARAFTVGQHVVFGAGQFAPHRGEGRRLLAHELAHTRQTGSEERVARDPVPEVQSKGIELDRTKIEALTPVSYWEQKVMQKFSLIYDPNAMSRLGKDAEERDAVLSSLMQHAPKAKVASSLDVVLSLAQRPSNPNSKQVLYQAKFAPAAKGATKDSAEVTFKQEGASAAVAAAPAPAAGYSPTAFANANFTSFPGTSAKYFTSHPDEHKQLFNWIDKAPAKFNQVVTTKETGKSAKVHESSFQVKGEKDPAGALTSLDIDFISETPTFIDTPPKGYAAKDGVDLEFDKQRDKKSDKLGQISGVDTLPADEQLSVKYVVWQYFAGGTRNKEVDVTLPVAHKTTNVYYTLRFRPNNDVDVERVGEPDSNEKLKATGMNITRVEGFANNSTDAAFGPWVKGRYPSVKVTGSTLPEKQDSVNKDMQANSGDPAWFFDNYQMTVLDDKAGAARLTGTHRLDALQTADMKKFQPDELKTLEFALETMSDAELKLLKDIRWARQKALLQFEGKGKARKLVTKSKTSGETFTTGSDKTIVIYDNVTVNDKALFMGGKGGVRETAVETYTHELGHALAPQNKIEESFAAFVKKKKINPITWYAASKPATESFPEAFAYYQSDPEWMQTNLPEMFAWFETLKKNGSPPPP
ncbi:MAG: DUF4157 domain-containing protein [Betaproteobacteria bacterium]|nr:DUF4157 domain-containing protein [Betaproteobacteria bacterium]